MNISPRQRRALETTKKSNRIEWTNSSQWVRVSLAHMPDQWTAHSAVIDFVRTKYTWKVHKSDDYFGDDESRDRKTSPLTINEWILENGKKATKYLNEVQRWQIHTVFEGGTAKKRHKHRIVMLLQMSLHVRHNELRVQATSDSKKWEEK